MAKDKDTARGGRVRERREAAGLTQTALARLLTVHYRTVQDWEAGHGISSTKLPLLAHALKTTAEYIRGETDDPYGDDDFGKRLSRLEALAGALADDRVSGEQSARAGFNTVAERISELRYSENPDDVTLSSLREDVRTLTAQIEELVLAVAALRRRAEGQGQSGTGAK